MPLRFSESTTIHVLEPQLRMEPCLLSLEAGSGGQVSLHRPGPLYLATCVLSCTAHLAPETSAP